MSDFGRHGRILNKKHLNTILLCLAGIAVNTILNTLVNALSLPLYLDTVGTMAVAAIGGYMPGVLVGFMTSITTSISNPSSIYYGSLNSLIAMVVAFIARRGGFKHARGIIRAVVSTALIGGILGSLISWQLEGISFSEGSLDVILFETGLFGALTSFLLSNLIMEIPDKLTAVLLTAVLLRILPKTFLESLSSDVWVRPPVIDKENSAGQGKKCAKLSLRGKMAVLFVPSMIAVSAVAVIISIRVYRNTLISEQARIANGTSGIAAGLFDGETLDLWLETGGGGEELEQCRENILNVLYSSTDIRAVYAFVVEKDGSRRVIFCESRGVSLFEAGDTLPDDEAYLKNKADFLAGRDIDPYITKTAKDPCLTAFQRFYLDGWDKTAYLAMDVDLAGVTDLQRRFVVEFSSLFLSFLVLLTTFFMWVTQFMISTPLNAITLAVEKFSEASNDQKELDDNVKNLRGLDIRSGDEVERIYTAISKMTADQTEQMRSIKRLSDSTAKMQDGLIITMADMVENRDSDTGAHIQKTAAYVKIIVEGLKSKGYYAEKITPKFMSDVVRSAPLHDVGKINIPDEVLNKPGKLTDAEFAIMKTHTTAGKKIMEHAISTVEGDSYLKEARNMAAYHHERWDGKGYPENLHGEVIPLSARIMAVADVFDALTSPRVYKPAFPLEKALSIIEEGKGTQFDPKCVEVFMDSLDEVKLVLQKYNPQ